MTRRRLICCGLQATAHRRSVRCGLFRPFQIVEGLATAVTSVRPTLPGQARQPAGVDQVLPAPGVDRGRGDPEIRHDLRDQATGFDQYMTRRRNWGELFGTKRS